MKKPEVFGKYLLVERISVGGMAEVFKAIALGLSGFRKTIAIKRILPHIGDDEGFVKMFVDEANIAGYLHHNNIAQVYDLGVISGYYFIAMEYIEGRDLRAVFNELKKRKTPIPINMAVFIAAQILAGLDYAHRKTDNTGQPLNIVHRDISPPNIILSYNGEVKLIDFGIAKAAKKASETQAGVLKGKFGYMSPEQVRRLKVDHRSDIFSIGIILHEMLSGRRLFIGESDFDVLEKVRDLPIDPPSAFSKDVPEALDNIVMRALARDVKKRYPSAIEMQHELLRYLYQQTPLYTEKALSQWMRDTFKETYEETLERMRQAQEIDFEQLGLDERAIEQATVESFLRPEIQGHPQVRKKQKETATSALEQKKETKTPSSAGFFALCFALALILAGLSALGIHQLDKLPQRSLRIGTKGETTTANFLANHKGASVVFNEETLCKTPCRIEDFPTGEHVVRFELEGFAADEGRFHFKKAQKAEVIGKLFKPESLPALLIVKTTPQGALVRLKDEAKGKPAPRAIRTHPNKEQPLLLHLSMEGYKDKIVSVNIEKQGFTTFHTTLTKIPPPKSEDASLEEQSE